jgi:hypothetical protein
MRFVEKERFYLRMILLAIALSFIIVAAIVKPIILTGLIFIPLILILIGIYFLVLFGMDLVNPGTIIKKEWIK